MANYNQNGRNATGNRSDDHGPSWRPQDQMATRDERDRHARDDRDDADRMSSERHGQGQSGYGAGRQGDDRAMMRGENRNQGYAHDERGSDRQQMGQGTGTDDRWGGRGHGSWEDRSDRPYQTPQNTAQGGYGGRDGNDAHGYQSGYNQQGFGPRDATSQGTNRGSEGGFRSGGSMGTQGYRDRPAPQAQRGYVDQSYGDHGQGGANQSHYGRPSQGLGQAGYGRGDQGSLDYRRMQPGEHRGKGPQGFQRSDERIREAVCEALTDDEHIDATSIEVTVKSGEVTLSGNVPDRQTKRMAEDCVEHLPGVKDVQNLLKIGRGNGAGAAKIDTSDLSNSDKKHRA